MISKQMSRLAFAVLSTLVASRVMAEVAPVEAQKLGDSLTWWGAEKAGNAEGTIPKYTGGLTEGPATTKIDDGYTVYPNPFASEKPRVVITAANMDEYRDKLTAGTIRLLETYPDFKINLYPTHRTTTYPDAIRQATIDNATVCATADGGESLSPECKPGIPFPIPTTGYQAMWNMQIPYRPPIWSRNAFWTVDPRANRTLASELKVFNDKPFWHRSYSEKAIYNTAFSISIAPPRLAGGVNAYTDFTNQRNRVAYAYDPGTRRVRSAPSYEYDTPLSVAGGAMFYDDTYLFAGKMDRFVFKLVGKQEMIIPYSSYDIYTAPPEKVLGANFVNPEVDRWELHRVWKVEATLKDGQRHGYGKRVLYIDESAPGLAAVDNYDNGGQLFRSGFNYGFQAYEHGFPYSSAFTIYDFSRKQYTFAQLAGGKGFKVVAPLPERDLTPQALGRLGI